MTCKGWRSKYDVENEKCSPKVNGSLCLGKRKRSQMKKHCGYLQEWLDKSWEFQQEPKTRYRLEDEHVSRVPASYWPNNPMPSFDRRLFPTASEPTMCRYSVPVGYSLEPVSLPVYATYVPVPSEPVFSRKRSSRPVAQSNRLHGQFMSAPPLSQDNCRDQKDGRRTSKLQSGMDSGTNEEFTSLPPAGKSHAPDTVHRRFSDPCIRRSPAAVERAPSLCYSADSSDSGDTCSRASTPTSNALVLSLVVQVNALQESNKQLYQELRATKAELESLKQSWQKLPPEYEPGMLSDLIREIRDAARVHEEVLLSRVCNMLQAAGKMNPANHLLGMKDNLVEKSPVRSQKMDEINDQFEHLQIQREKTKPSIDEGDGSKDNQAEQLCALELENLQLRHGLEEAVARSKEKESHAQQLEHLVDVLRRKINGVSVDDKPASSEQSPSESLVSTASSSSTTHSPHVTMSGPVTDL